MINIFSFLNRIKINRIYSLSEEYIYKYRFLRDLSSGYAYVLGGKIRVENF